MGAKRQSILRRLKNRLALEGVSDKKLKMVSFREALLNKVPDAWRQAVFNPDGSVNLSPEIVLMLRTFKTAGAAVASRDQFDLIGRWANVPKRLAVHTPVADTGGLRRRRGVTRVAVNTIREVMSPLERLTLIPGKDEPPA